MHGDHVLDVHLHLHALPVTKDHRRIADLLFFRLGAIQGGRFASESENHPAVVRGRDPNPVDHQAAGPGNLSDPAEPAVVTGVDDPSLPTRFALHGNVPNPFNPTTTINNDLPAASMTHSGSSKFPVVWRGRDHAGQQVSAGVHFYRMEGGTFSQTQRMVLVKLAGTHPYR